MDIISTNHSIGKTKCYVREWTNILCTNHSICKTQWKEFDNPFNLQNIILKIFDKDTLTPYMMLLLKIYHTIIQSFFLHFLGIERVWTDNEQTLNNGGVRGIRNNWDTFWIQKLGQEWTDIICTNHSTQWKKLDNPFNLEI